LPQQRSFAITFHCSFDDGCRVLVFTRENAVGGFDEVHLRTEACEALRHFAADRTGANDAKPLRQFGEREQRFVREIGNILQARNRRRGGACASSDDRFGETQRLSADFNGIRPGELA
jgi:hypothetical protein